MAALFRTLIYAVVIAALVAIFLPSEGLGVGARSSWGAYQIVGAAITLLGGALWIWCALTFAVIGRGTPLPLDPPRRLVVAGPYRSVRNPMAVGAVVTVLGVALFYESPSLLVFDAVFVMALHAFVVLYEETTLQRVFGAEYAAYCQKVRRWVPGRPVPADAGDGTDEAEV